MKTKIFFIIIISIVITNAIEAQKRPLDLAVIGEKLKDFQLPSYQGEVFQLSKNLGKNILLVFPRGYYDQDTWCDICAYEYLDLVEEFSDKKLANKYDLEVIVILPYSIQVIEKWLSDIPEVYESLEAGKHLSDTTTNERARTWARFANEHYPKTFNIKKGDTPNPFLILSDQNHELSERLDIFRTEWWGTKVDQNIPTIILLDKTGKVVFKYISQHTIDRPTTNYLIKVMSLLSNQH